MFRKAAPAVLFLAFGLFVVAVAWAQSTNNGRPTTSPLGQFRDFILGDDQEPTPTRDVQQRRARETRTGDRQTNNDNRDADDNSNSQTAPPQPAQRTQSQTPTQASSRNDFGGDRKFRSSPPANSDNSAARRQSGGNAQASPYQYSGQYADTPGNASSGEVNQPSSRRTPQQSMGARIEQQFSGAGRDREAATPSATAGRNVARPNNSNSNNEGPTTVNNPHVAAQIDSSSPSVMRQSNDANGPTQARTNRSVQDRLSAAQVAADEAPPVKVPSPAEAPSKSLPSSRRTANNGAAANGNTNSSTAAGTAPSGPRAPIATTTISRDSTPAVESAPARVAARPEAPIAAAVTPPAPAATPSSSRRTTGGPLAGIADSRPAKRPELPVDNVLFSRQSPLISVETSGPKTISMGKEATYIVTLQNSGDVAAQDVVVGIKVPEWADVVGAQTSSGITQPAAQPGEPYQWKLSRFESRAKETLSLRLVPRQSRPFDLGVQYTFSPIASQAVVEVQEPKLVLDLVGPKEVAYGQTKVFRLTLSNPGTGDAENIIIKLLPLGERKDTGASHQLGTLAAGESKVIEVELTARETGTLNIRAEAVADGGLRAEVADVVLVRRAGLQIDVDSPKVKYAGTPATFVVRVANPGNANAENVQLTATLPTGAKFISASAGGQLTSDQGAVSWNLGTLSPGSGPALEVKCLLNSPGVNRLQVVSTASEELSATGDSSTQVEALADLKLEIMDPQGPVAVGEEAVYEVHVKNRGTKAAEQIEVVSFFSSGLEPTTAQGGQFEIGRGQVTFSPVATLSPGNEIVLKIRAAADKPGSHVFRTEVLCRSLESKLASEVTTRFYGDESAVPTEAKHPTPAVHRTQAVVPLPKSDEPRPFPAAR